MKTKMIESDRYELIECTAVATEAGDTERQHAILCRDLSASCDADSVIFGCCIDEVDDLYYIDTISTDQDTLDTVLIDGLPINSYVSGKL